MIYQVGAFDGYIQQRPFAGIEVMRIRCLIEMPQVVKLMTQLRIFFPAFLADPGVHVKGIDGTVRVQIAIGLLREGDKIDDRVDAAFQLLIRICLQRITGSFDYFFLIRMIKGIFGLKLLLCQLAGNLEIFDPTGLVTLGNGDGNGNFLV